MSSRRLPVALGERAYEIQIGRGLLAQAESWAILAGRRRVLVTDRNVAALHLPTVKTVLGLSDEDCLIVESGEPVKSWDTAEQVLDWMLSKRLARDAVLIALGGGVIGDLAGFCAAIYQRGIDFVQVPTTLLSMVDSSVGGKTGVNHPRGKNLIGAFHQPRAVIADLDSLKTLPRRELSAGAAEVIKYGMLGDAAFFAELERGALVALICLLYTSPSPRD